MPITTNPEPVRRERNESADLFVKNSKMRLEVIMITPMLPNPRMTT